MEEVARYECVYNRNSKDFKDKNSCLNWKIHCEDHSSLSSMTAVQIYELFHIYLHHFTPYGKI